MTCVVSWIKVSNKKLDSSRLNVGASFEGMRRTVLFLLLYKDVGYYLYSSPRFTSSRSFLMTESTSFLRLGVVVVKSIVLIADGSHTWNTHKKTHAQWERQAHTCISKHGQKVRHGYRHRHRHRHRLYTSNEIDHTWYTWRGGQNGDDRTFSRISISWGISTVENFCSRVISSVITSKDGPTTHLHTHTHTHEFKIFQHMPKL